MGAEENHCFSFTKALCASGDQQNIKLTEVSLVSSSNLTVVPNEPPVEIYKPQELLELPLRLGDGPLLYCSNLFWVRFDASALNDIAQERDSFNMKITFLGLHK